MSQEQIPKLFNAYTKFSINRHLNREGVGLGLTISLNLAKALGGDIRVDSKVDVGSTFCLRIPWVRPIGQKLTSSSITRGLYLRRESNDENQLLISDNSDAIYSDKLLKIQTQRVPRLLR